MSFLEILLDTFLKIKAFQMQTLMLLNKTHKFEIKTQFQILYNSLNSVGPLELYMNANVINRVGEVTF